MATTRNASLYVNILNLVNIVYCFFFLRRALRRDESVKYLIPDSVIEYIKANNLYLPEK